MSWCPRRAVYTPAGYRVALWSALAGGLARAHDHRPREPDLPALDHEQAAQAVGAGRRPAEACVVAPVVELHRGGGLDAAVLPDELRAGRVDLHREIVRIRHVEKHVQVAAPALARDAPCGRVREVGDAARLCRLV